jgi:hypothetical protein
MTFSVPAVWPARLIRIVATGIFGLGCQALPLLAVAAPPDAQTRSSAAGGSAPGAAAAQPAPTIHDTLVAVRQIAHELKAIDERLGALEKSVGGINASLAPVGAVVQPEKLKETLNLAGDVAWERGRALILLATACVGGLLVLHAILRRWFGGYRSSRL